MTFIGLKLLPLIAALALIASACTSNATTEEIATLPDIPGVEQLAADFTEDEGSTRLILLLSPT